MFDFSKQPNAQFEGLGGSLAVSARTTQWPLVFQLDLLAKRIRATPLRLLN